MWGIIFVPPSNFFGKSLIKKVKDGWKKFDQKNGAGRKNLC